MHHKVGRSCHVMELLEGVAIAIVLTLSLKM
jgi:hypothetical protein